MSVINIAKLDKAKVLAALFNNARIDGPGLGMQMDIKEARLILDATSYPIERLRCRDLGLTALRTSETMLDVEFYNTANGEGKAQQVINNLRVNDSIDKI